MYIYKLVPNGYNKLEKGMDKKDIKVYCYSAMKGREKYWKYKEERKKGC